VSTRTIAAVIPAAGKGSRLGLSVPKLLAPLTDTVTVWDVLRDVLEPYVDRLHVVVSPAALPLFESHLHKTNADLLRITCSIQREPTGMGDAVFSGLAWWQGFDDILVMWGDQIFVSPQTIGKAIELQRRTPPPSLTVPLCRLEEPYVDYVLDEKGLITRVLQTREGDRCRRHGMSDVGTFVISTAGLATRWREYGATGRGARTGELNFLPFLAHLSSGCSWNTQHFEISDTRESRGINTPEDLLFFQQLLTAPAQAGGRARV
jgi:bifunctional UDP-N-acetylglucosamine pyrophosphorylase/glucosamine-1-phosphate N-acetyltransferase